MARSSGTTTTAPVGSAGSLDAYDAKRDFAVTPEPKGPGRLKPGARFVVQKHAARRLHYDFRLELDGVLKSWAVTRGPSLVVGEKRLAVETEDHPLTYLKFEGVIPAGQYGGGSVIVWDLGTWKAEGDPRAGLATGKLTFTLKGKRLQGRWHLVRTRPRGGRQQWLLLKAEDDAARDAEAPDVLDQHVGSVLTGRTNAELEADGALRVDHAVRERVAKTRRGGAGRGRAGSLAPPGARPGLLPVFVEPCLATLAQAAPEAGDWLHEIKFDGYRLQARIDGDGVKLLTRSGLDWTDRFSGLVGPLRHLGVPSALVDGEVVVEDAAGVSSFSALQADLKAGRGDRLVFYAFDLLYLDGRDLRPLPLVDRKAALQAVLDETSGPLRFSEHVAEDGAAMKRHACRMGLEGIVSKRADRPYRSGRGGDWLKVKCTARQELVVAGYGPSTVAKRAVGSLILGVYDEAGALHHVGRAGTGYTAAEAHDLWTALDPLRRPAPPFAGPLPAEALRGSPVWVEPRLVAEVELRGWTGDGQIRHAAFKGLRDDKPARDVRRESPPGDAPAAAATPARRRKAVALPVLTHPDRVLWDDAGLTKQGLAGFYTDIADWILPQIVDRPLSLLRGPDGAGGKTFFQKHAWAGLDETAVRRLTLGGDDVLVVQDLAGLLSLVQASVLEIHPWGAKTREADRPDRIVIDLDPGESVGWAEVVAGAVAVRERLAALGHTGFLKTTGGHGLHVVVPLRPAADWSTVKAFAKRIADAMAGDDPARFIATSTKAGRQGRIYVDYLRNGRGATAVAAYSTRARPGAPVAVPVSWDEVGDLRSGAAFSVDNLPRRLDNLAADPWADMAKAARPLEAASRKRAGASAKRRDAVA